MKEHKYQSKIEWTGNKGSGTENYRNYERSHNIIIENKPTILGTSDVAFRGDKNKHNPEDFLVSSLSSCHMLWYLHFCSVNNIIVEEYSDIAEGIMVEEPDGKGYFKEVLLNPIVTVKSQEMAEMALELHKKANEYCFIANSVNFPVKHQPKINFKSNFK
ncbi:OsmC family protein [Empedobacter brevis]|uniref:OsmC family protein n=1 Tax=Empedobacter brevis TaxID=247 RepID=UPI0039AF497C